MQAGGEKIYCFEDFTLDLKRGALRHGDREIDLRPKSFEVLRYLVENAGRLVPKDELIEVAWPNVVVTDESLARCVSDVRQALGDGDQRIIKTVPRRGYLFASRASLSSDDAGSSLPAPNTTINDATASYPAVAPRSLKRRVLRGSAAVLAAALLLAAGLWTVSQLAPVPEKTAPVPRLSIVVLPFVNLSGDPQQDYIADVITEELTSRLSRIRGSFVIARTTAFTYKGKGVDVKQVGKDLGVRYVLEGSEQHTDTRMRVNAQLISAETGAHLWADQFDSDRNDFLWMQDEVVTRLARALQLELIASEANRVVHASAPDAEDFALRCDGAVNRWVNAGAYDSAGEPEAAYRLCERALELDESNVRAQIIMADLLGFRVLASRSRDPEADLRRADGLVSRAIAADPNHYWAHYSKAAVLLAQKQTEAALVEADRSLALNSSFTPPYLILCVASRFLGRQDKAIEYADAATRLSPRDPFLHFVYLQKGLAYFALGKDNEAIDWLTRVAAARPEWPVPRVLLAAAFALNDQGAEAHDALEQYFRYGHFKTIAQLKALPPEADTPAYLAYRERFYQGLRKAGMPEE